MFGYIRPFQPELRMKEYEAYISVYCGLCKELGRRYGIFARFTLSYDFTFLAILSMAVQTNMPDFTKIHCLINPFKKCSACRLDGVTDRIAAQEMITLYYKCQDQLSDENWVKNLPVRIVLPFFRHCWRNARQKETAYDNWIAEMMQAQQLAESQQAGPDPAAEPTARCLSLTCEALSNDPVQKRVLSRFGYLLGRYVYLSDALDDLEKDEKLHRFNPFLQHYNVSELKSLSYSPVVESLNGTIAELEKAFVLLKLNDWQPVLENIVYWGLKQSLQTKKRKKEKNA